MREQEYIEFEDCTLVRQTEKAGLFKNEEWAEAQWIPWSQALIAMGERDLFISRNGSVTKKNWNTK
jgi:hypothetical protein